MSSNTKTPNKYVVHQTGDFNFLLTEEILLKNPEASDYLAWKPTIGEYCVFEYNRPGKQPTYEVHKYQNNKPTRNNPFNFDSTPYPIELLNTMTIQPKGSINE